MIRLMLIVMIFVQSLMALDLGLFKKYNYGVQLVTDNELGYGLYMQRVYKDAKVTLSYTVYDAKKFIKDITSKSKRARSCEVKEDVCDSGCMSNNNDDNVNNVIEVNPGVNDETASNGSTVVSDSYTDDLDVVELTGEYPLCNLSNVLKISALAGAGISWNNYIDQYGFHAPVGISISNYNKSDLNIGISYRYNIDINNRHIDKELIVAQVGWNF